MTSTIIEIDGSGLSVADLVKIGYHNASVSISDEAWTGVREGRGVIDDILTLNLLMMA